MPIYSLGGKKPQFVDRNRAYVAPSADLIGQINLGLDTSIWFTAVIRADHELIEIGNESNVQDGAMLHADPGKPIFIGAGCTIGHRAIVHGAIVESNSLIGMGATLLNGSRIGENSIVGANTLVTEHKTFPPASLIMGTPAKLIRELSLEEIEGLRLSAALYVVSGRRFATGLRCDAGDYASPAIASNSCQLKLRENR